MRFLPFYINFPIKYLIYLLHSTKSSVFLVFNPFVKNNRNQSHRTLKSFEFEYIKYTNNCWKETLITSTDKKGRFSQKLAYTRQFRAFSRIWFNIKNIV